jgi:hypothetical protein
MSKGRHLLNLTGLALGRSLRYLPRVLFVSTRGYSRLTMVE